MKGIDVRPGASVEDMQVALTANFEEENLSVREVFDRYFFSSFTQLLSGDLFFSF
jgi:hypothetical protein